MIRQHSVIDLNRAAKVPFVISRILNLPEKIDVSIKDVTVAGFLYIKCPFIEKINNTEFWSKLFLVLIYHTLTFLVWLSLRKHPRNCLVGGEGGWQTSMQRGANCIKWKLFKSRLRIYKAFEVLLKFLNTGPRKTKCWIFPEISTDLNY